MQSAVAGAKAVALERGGPLPPDPVDPETDPYAWVPMIDYLQYLEESARRLGMPELGLAISGRFDVTGLGPLGLLFISSQTPFEALAQLKIFLQAWQEDTDVEVEQSADLYAWVYRVRTPALRRLRTQDALLSLGVVTNWLRARLGPHWNPAEVHLGQAAPADPAVLARFFRAPLYFDQPINGLFIDREDGDRRAREQMPAFVPFMRRHLKDLIERPAAEKDLVEAVRAEVGRRLGLAPVTQAAISDALGLSSRTLQRRLADAGTGLRAIVDEQRRQMAREILENPGSIGRLARQLGYADAATACRAVRRLTGHTPSALVGMLAKSNSDGN